MQHLLLLVFFSFQLIRGDNIDIDMAKDKRYLQKHPQSSINASTCEEYMVFHDEEDYADYCDPKVDENCSDEPACHFSRLNDTLRSDLVGEEVVKLLANNSRTCCSFHGFIETASVCDGRDKTGKEVDFSNVDVCVEHIHQGEIEVKPALDCPLHCQLVHGPLELFKNHIKGGVLTYENKTYENFCLGLKCNDERFQPWFEACGECVTDEINRNLSTRTGLPNCCGLNDTMKLNGRSLECSSEKRNPALEKEFEVCHYRNKQSLKLTTDRAKLSESICVQV